MLQSRRALRVLLRLEREAEHGEVRVEAEDGRGRSLARGDGADAVSEREGAVGIALHYIPGLAVEFLVGVSNQQAPCVNRLFDQGPERERGAQARVIAQPRGRLGED